MIRIPGHLPGYRGAALVLGLWFASCIPTRKEPDIAGSGTELGNVVGSIYTADNRPAAGVTVTLYPENPVGASVRTAVTDAEGGYAFKDVIGAYTLFALDGAGNGLKVDSIHASIADSIDLDRLNLSPLASVSGYVKVIGVRPEDPENPVEPQAEMSLSNSPFRNKVDPNAAFLWSDLPAGRYWLSIYYSWSKEFKLAVTLVPGQTLDLDTVTLVNEYASDIGGGGDTLKVSASQLPLQLGNKLAPDIGAVDSLIWTLNGGKMAVDQTDRATFFNLEAGMLRDTGHNVIEMRLYLADTTVLRSWYIDFEDSPMIPWARHAVKGVFLGSEANSRPDNDGMELGSFRVLERRLLSEAEMAFWNFSPVPGGDTALPESIKIPMHRNEHGNPFECGDMSYNMEPELFPGDTVTFLTEPDEYWGGMSFRIRKHEDYSSFDKLSWFADAAWPLAESYAGNGGTRDIRLGAEALSIRLNLNLPAPSMTGNGCLPLSRGFALGADGIPNEYVAMPNGMSSGNLLLHFRAGLPDGLFTEALAGSGDYVFLDSAGHGVAGSGTDRRVVQLSVSEVAELKALLAPLPAVIPIEWNRDYIESRGKEVGNYYPLLLRTNYLLSGGRGCLLLGEPRNTPVPEAKLNLFRSVEAWLRSHDLL
jgi:hypothetical protein